MFRHASVLGLLLLVAASLPALAIPITQVNGKFDCPELDNQRDCAAKAERALIAAHRAELSRTGDTLHVRLMDGGHISLKDDADHGYNAVDWNAAGRFVAIRVQYAEGNSWQVLDRHNGKLKDIHGYPLFSPNGAEFVAASEDLDAGYSETVFDVYRVSPGGIMRVFQAIPHGAHWSARDVAWDGNTKIRFQHTTLEWDGFILRPAVLVERNDQWNVAR